MDSENNTIKFAIQPGTIRTAIVILANELGYYKEEGVDVDSIQLVEVDSQR
ncbi:ABC transporter substrate-binding protein [Coprococcus comes]|uniref:ABC transporter substrate-binding protein n=1 Tax=Coprococcus comes TaxID=410072 RepID=UPI0034A374ED